MYKERAEVPKTAYVVTVSLGSFVHCDPTTFVFPYSAHLTFYVEFHWN